MRVVCVFLVLAIACGGAQHTREPSATVKSELTLAEDAERARKHDVARVHYEKAIAIATDPTSNAHARRVFAETLATWGEFKEAMAQLELSVQLISDNAVAWHDLGILRHKQGDVPGAIAAIERARTLAPDDHRPRVSLGVIKWKAGDRAGAKAEYEALLEMEIPDRLRVKVKWAIDQLAKP